MDILKPPERKNMKIVRFNELEYVPASHEDAHNPGVWKKVLLAKPDFIQGGLQMINWALLPAGKAFSAHYHEDMQEVFVIIKGKARIIVDDQAGELAAGDAVVIPVRAVHVMEAVGDHDVEYIALGISTGAGGKTIVV